MKLVEELGGHDPTLQATSGIRDETAVAFVVGSPRSGTTWLQRLLASHPDVVTGQETNVISNYVGPLIRSWRKEVDREESPERSTGRGGIGLPCYFTEAEFEELVRGWCRELYGKARRRTGERGLFLDKTPSHALFLREIKVVLPFARIIHLIRDPRDVVASLLRAAEGWGRGWAPKTSRKAALVWKRHVKAACEVGRELAPQDYLEMRYEALVADPEAELIRAAAFLGLSWDSEEVSRAVARNRREVLRAGRGTPIVIHGEFGRRDSIAREPEGFVGSVENGDWRQSLNLLDRLHVRAVAGPLMRELGYEWSWRDLTTLRIV